MTVTQTMTATLPRHHDSWLHKYNTPPRHMPLSRAYRDGSISEENFCRSASPQVPHLVGTWVFGDEKAEEGISTRFVRPRSLSYTSLNLADQQFKNSRKVKVGGIQKRLASNPSSKILSEQIAHDTVADLVERVSMRTEAVSALESGETCLDALASTSEVSREQAHVQADERKCEDMSREQVHVQADERKCEDIVPVETQQECLAALPQRQSWMGLLLAAVSGVQCHPLICSATKELSTPSQRIAAIKIAPRIRL